MVFAVSASFLWMLTVFYSAGYMRGLKEHAQTRFNACFALALFGAIGCAFADNLLTLYLFYEIVSVCTYPLVAHHQDEESYEGAKKYMVYLTATAKGLVLPAMVLIYVLTGNLDFARNIRDGILPADAGRLGGDRPVCLLPPGLRQERHHALPPLAARRHGGAHAGQRAAARGGRGQGGRVLDRPGDALRVRGGPDGCAEPGVADRVVRFHHDPRRLGDRAEQGQPEGPAGVLHGEPALLHHSRAWLC